MSLQKGSQGSSESPPGVLQGKTGQSGSGLEPSVSSSHRWTWSWALGGDVSAPLCRDVLSGVGGEAGNHCGLRRAGWRPSFSGGSRGEGRRLHPGDPHMVGLLHRPREARGRAGGWEGKACPRSPGSHTENPEAQGPGSHLCFGGSF